MCWSSWYQSTASWMTPWGQRRGYTKISLTFIRVTGREIPRRSCDALDSCKAFFFCPFFFVFKNTILFWSFWFCSSSEKIQALHMELDSVQALRRQLEEVLSRTRNTALLLDRAAKKQPDFGGGNGQGPASKAASTIVTWCSVWPQHHSVTL